VVVNGVNIGENALVFDLKEGNDTLNRVKLRERNLILEFNFDEVF
jgi:hypothetical protein